MLRSKNRWLTQLDVVLCVAAVLTVAVLETTFLFSPEKHISRVSGWLCFPGLVIGFFAGAFTTTREANLDIVMIVISVAINTSIYYLLFKLTKSAWKERSRNGHLS